MSDQFNPFELKQQFAQQKKSTGGMPKGIRNLLVAGAVVVVLVIVALFALSSFTFTVGEREQVVVTEFDRIVRIIVDDVNAQTIQDLKNNPRYANVKIQQGKGLFFKTPFIQTVHRYTNMLLTYDTQADEVFTLDKKKLLLDNNAQWRIENPALFMNSIGTMSSAHQRIDEYIYSRMREEIGRIEAKQLVADKEYVENMLMSVRDYVHSQVSPYGIAVVDIRIKRTEYPDETKPSIYEQMRSERQAVATQYRADGQSEARRILAEANRKATIIEAQAYETAEKTKGEGDGEAVQIYAEAYNTDIEFYTFYRTLQAYEKIIDDDTTIFIHPGSDLMKFLFSAE
jgi:membrane protease subunit HflC